MLFTETAFAKINLTLKVLGKRSDSYHELESLVAFAQIGDTLTLQPGQATQLSVDGPFAGALNQDNLVLRAAELVHAQWPQAFGGAFHLTKILPVAAGIGGGSADAAAALRLLAAAYPAQVDSDALPALAVALGADVPVCLASRAAMMRGIGEQLTPIDEFCDAAVLLINPGIPVATEAVFTERGARKFGVPVCAKSDNPSFATVEQLAAFIGETGNDLEAPARAIAPVIGEVKSQLAGTWGCLASGLSGSGATCFGLFASLDDAQSAEQDISAAQPDWWVKAAALQ